MKRNQLICLAAALIVAVGLAGCGNGEFTTIEPADSYASAPPAAPPAPAAPAPMPTAGGAAVVRTAIPTGDPANSVLLLEQTAPAQVIVGADFSYNVRLTNLTAKALQGVVLTTKMPASFQAAGTTPAGALTGNTAKWSIGQLGPRASATVSVRGRAKATGEIIGCSDVTFDIPEACLSIRAVQPALKIEKTAPATAILCDVIPTKIVVTNTGSGSATNVNVRDVLPAGVQTIDGRSEVTVNLGTLAAGQAREISVQTKATKAGTYTNTATVTADGGLTAQASATTAVRVPVLVVKKTGPAIRFVGRPATYAITVTNTGDAEARNTVLVDQVPAGVQVVSATQGATAAGSQVSWQLGTLAPGASKTVSLNVRMTTQGVKRNVATASAYCAKGAAELTTTVKGISAILLECVDLEDPIEVGSNVTYVITVTNQGSAVGTNTVIDCTLPDEQQFVSATGPTKGTAAARKVTFAPLASLAPKATATYRVIVKAVKEGDVRFGVSLTSDQMTSPASETESTHQYK
jgi:uncharacterized repeat protein (TIGR01451 family)